MVALKCDHCGRRVPYIVETIKRADGTSVDVRNYHPTIKPGHVVLCFRCAPKHTEKGVIRG